MTEKKMDVSDSHTGTSIAVFFWPEPVKRDRLRINFFNKLSTKFLIFMILTYILGTGSKNKFITAFSVIVLFN